MCWCLFFPLLPAQRVGLRVARRAERRVWRGVPSARVSTAGALLLFHELEECSGRAPRSRDVSAFSSLTVTPPQHTHSSTLRIDLHATARPSSPSPSHRVLFPLSPGG